jgi:hypothetical protein
MHSIAFDARTAEVFIVVNARLFVRHLERGETFRPVLHLNKVAQTHDVAVVLFQKRRDTGCFRICVYE